MQPVERNARFSNPLVHSSSLYLRQHAHNPVYWYPWGKEAIERARSENKPILLSIGYSTCYWCHVMEREVFENLSIASMMNRLFINIKVDREEHPQLDDIYMVARQMMTHQGGWPNNVFLTPDLHPFFAGGTYAPDESQPGRPSWPRLLEWLHFSWTTQEGEVRKVASDITSTMLPHLVHVPVPNAKEADTGEQAAELFALLKKHHDPRAGGFFQAPKFPHECYLDFLTAYHEYTGHTEALDMAVRTLQKMAAGGMYDQIGCGFHRYAIDADWLVPHFEKMLYNQAQLARNYTEGARLTNNAWFADIARSILEYVSGPLTDGQGAFYTGIDAETDGVEGAYYAWTAEEIQQVLDQGETAFFLRFFAMADIPKFPGHPHTDGQTITLRKPLDIAARDHNMPYVQVAAMAGLVMNKLLAARNKRKSPARDEKIIVGWNGLMIDAFAHAGRVLDQPEYTAKARKAADFILEKAIDNEGKLHRIYAAGKPQHDATLEDYAYLVRGLISLYRATPEPGLLESATSLMARAGELFTDGTPGYYGTQQSDYLLVRGKSADDGATISPNAAMLHNLVDLAEITGDSAWLAKAKAHRSYFMDGKQQVLVESAGMLQAALKLEAALKGKVVVPKTYSKEQTMEGAPAPDGLVTLSAALFPANAKPGEPCELILTLDIKEGWHINGPEAKHPSLIPTQVAIEGKDLKVEGAMFPEPLRKESGEKEPLPVYEGLVNITLRLRLAPGGKKRPKLKVRVRFQPCSGSTCHAVQDMVISV